MTARGRILGAAIAAGIMNSLTGSLALAVNNPLDYSPRNDAADVPGTPDLGTGPAVPAEKPISGNPLWGIPLSSLRATRERPIYLQSRRPPAPAVAAAPRVEPVQAISAQEPEKPALTLLGVVTGTTTGIAVFTDETTRDIIRLKMGEGHNGWILRSVTGREAVLEKDRRTAVIGLPLPTGDQK
jgi:hypothetical protein